VTAAQPGERCDWEAPRSPDHPDGECGATATVAVITEYDDEGGMLLRHILCPDHQIRSGEIIATISDRERRPW
jgi:hypothetical protein